MNLYKQSVAVAFFMLYTVLSCTAQPNNLDFRILRNIAANRTDGKNNFYKAVSNYSSPIFISAPVALLIAGIIKKDKQLKNDALFIAETYLVNSAATWSLKRIINRDRPAIADPSFIAIESLSSKSFPSGHTSEAFAVATSLSIVYPKWYVIAPSFAFATLVGYSRLYLGVHYPSDVLAGAIVGSGSAWLVFQANKWINQKKKKREVAILE